MKVKLGETGRLNEGERGPVSVHADGSISIKIELEGRQSEWQIDVAMSRAMKPRATPWNFFPISCASQHAGRV